MICSSLASYRQILRENQSLSMASEAILAAELTRIALIWHDLLNAERRIRLDIRNGNSCYTYPWMPINRH